MRQAATLTHYVDGTIVFGVPLVAFGMQAAMLKDTEFGAAFSALAVAAFYLTLATMLRAKHRDSLRLLVESFLALGVGFATLAVPLALDARWTSAVWAVEGAAIVWVGVRQNRRLARAFGMFLQIAAGLAFLSKFNRPLDPEHLLPVLNANYLGCVMVSVAGLFINYYAERRRDVVGKDELMITRALFVWGAVWWFAGGVREIEWHIHGGAQWIADLAFFALSCGVFAALWRRLDWFMARYAALALWPLMAIIVIGTAIDGLMTMSPGPPASQLHEDHRMRRPSGQDRAEVPAIRGVSGQRLKLAQHQTGTQPRFNGAGDERLIGRSERPLGRSRIRSSHTRRIIPSGPKVVTNTMGIAQRRRTSATNGAIQLVPTRLRIATAPSADPVRPASQSRQLESRNGT